MIAPLPTHPRPILAATMSVFGLMAVVSLGGCKSEPASAGPAPQPVRVMAVEFGKSETARSYTGTVKARIESDLGFRVPGKIAERLVDVGKVVRAGDVIAMLDATDYRLALETQQAELKAATSARDQAVAAEGRYRQLLDKGYVSTAALEQRTAAADEARQRVEKAVRAIATAQNQLEYTELKADRAGVIALIPVEAGQVVSAGQTVARLAKGGELEAVVSIPEQQLDEIWAGTASVKLWSNDATTYRASLREVSPEADAGSRTYQARFSIPDPDQRVTLGMTATVIVSRPLEKPVAHVPLSAVMNDGRGASVYTVDGDGARIRRAPVDVVSYGHDDVTVSGGLADGQRIVTLGTQMLDESQPIRIVEAVQYRRQSVSAAR